MRIRDATPADMSQITRCAVDFFKYAGYAERGLLLDPASFQAMVTQYMANGTVLLLVDDQDQVRGGIAGMPSPWGFNHNITIMLELFFWIDPEHRRGTWAVRMLREFEHRARTMGAHIMAMVSVPSHLEDGVRRLYERCGYGYGEQFYYKQLGGENA